MLGRGFGARVGVLLALACSGVVPSALGETRRVVITGDVAPGLGTFSGVSGFPVINDSGQVVFPGSGANATSGFSAIFRAESNGALVLIARAGGPAPDGGNYQNVGPALLAENGEVQFRSLSNMFEGDGFSASTIVRIGSPSPDGGTWTVIDPFTWGFSEGGVSGFVATTSLGTAVYTMDGVGSNILAREGDGAPGTGAGTLSTLKFGAINAGGKVVFSAATSTGSGVFRGDGGGVVVSIARNGDAAPGGGTYTNLDQGPVINSAGRVAFHGFMTGSADGIFHGSSASDLVVVARDGMPAPGGGTFTGFTGRFQINNANQVSFSASTTTTTGVFRGDGTNLVSLARINDAAPDGNGQYSALLAKRIAAGGQVLFSANFANTLGGTTDTMGLVLTDGIDRVVVARSGQVRDGSTIAVIDSGAVYDSGGSSALNDHGQVVYRATLSDGRSGVYVYTPDLHWRSGASGSWDTAGAWTLSLRPGAPHPVFVDPTADAVIGGPVSNTTVKSLEVGSPLNSAQATLRLAAPAALNASEIVRVHPTGVLEVLDGALNAGQYYNNGLMRVRGGTVGGGTLVNTGTLAFDSGAMNGPISNSGLMEVNGSLFIQQIQNFGEIRITAPGMLDVGSGTQNAGTITLKGGSLVGSNALVNLGTVRGNGNISGSALFSNFGQVRITGSMTMLNYENYGMIEFEAPGLLHVGGSTANNRGTIRLAGGSITGGLSNLDQGVLIGPGGVFLPFTNSGSVLAPAGNLNLAGAVTNEGLIEVQGGAITGGTMTNRRMIQGHGAIANNITNSIGTIESRGGTLTLSNGVTNQEAGRINVTAGSKLLITGRLFANAGAITLSGGTFDYASEVVSNNNLIGFSAGASDFFGAINNNAGGLVVVSGNGTGTFHSPFTNNAGSELRVSNGATAVFFAPVTNNGTIAGGGDKFFELGGSNLGALATTGTTTVAEPASIAAAHIRESALTIAGKVTITPNGTQAGTSRLGALSIHDGGMLNLSNNDLVIDGGDLAQVEGYLASGKLTSSAATGITTLGAILNGARFTSFSGQTVSPDDVLVKYTYFGDTNLDGRVSIVDYLAADRGAARGLSGWANGDVDYSGVVDGADFFLIDSAFLGQGAALNAPAVAGDGSAFSAAVPEPGVMGPLVVMAAFLGRGRRRHV